MQDPYTRFYDYEEQNSAMFDLYFGIVASICIINVLICYLLLDIARIQGMTLKFKKFFAL